MGALARLESFFDQLAARFFGTHKAAGAKPAAATPETAPSYPVPLPASTTPQALPPPARRPVVDHIKPQRQSGPGGTGSEIQTVLADAATVKKVAGAAGAIATAAGTTVGHAAAAAAPLAIPLAAVGAIAASLIAPNLESTKAAAWREQFYADNILHAEIVRAKNPHSGDTEVAGGFRGTEFDEDTITTVTNVGPQSHLNAEGATDQNLWDGQFSTHTASRRAPPPPPPPSLVSRPPGPIVRNH